MFEVVYYSMTGNTKKVAEAIAAELGVKAENVKAKKKDWPKTPLFFWVLVATEANLVGNCRGLLKEMILKGGRWRYLGLQEEVWATK